MAPKAIHEKSLSCKPVLPCLDFESAGDLRLRGPSRSAVSALSGLSAEPLVRRLLKLGDHGLCTSVQFDRVGHGLVDFEERVSDLFAG